ncbi:hypothetical protein SKAU_G00069130 [Synaphobranchus kaupii]|uniref:Uncharacterized protein n=1 Tax=Synaphobranchus kaupii TaxID=118154 RepID=A0A9Q1G7A7_SYNKA|nr:hypothetical protein SKAU_G00069130 [Synaphobranchus kaupii]
MHGPQALCVQSRTDCGRGSAVQAWPRSSPTRNNTVSSGHTSTARSGSPLPPRAPRPDRRESTDEHSLAESPPPCALRRPPPGQKQGPVVLQRSARLHTVKAAAPRLPGSLAVICTTAPGSHHAQLRADTSSNCPGPERRGGVAWKYSCGNGTMPISSRKTQPCKDIHMGCSQMDSPTKDSETTLTGGCAEFACRRKSRAPCSCRNHCGTATGPGDQHARERLTEGSDGNGRGGVAPTRVSASEGMLRKHRQTSSASDRHVRV